MKRLHPLALACAVFATTAATADDRITPQPEPGLWRSEATTLINGQDAQAAVRKAQEEMLKNFPAEQRAEMERAMGTQEDLRATMDCITAEEAARMTDPEALLAEAQREMDGCDLNIERAGESRLTFEGTCSGGDGFAGDMVGELEMISSREMRSKFTGKGNYEIDTAQVPPDSPAMGGGPLNIQHTEVTKWVSADCGDVTPRVRSVE
ncbi:hypothetical protein LCGC14_0215780 [marine sediment metagenome]